MARLYCQISTISELELWRSFWNVDNMSNRESTFQNERHSSDSVIGAFLYQVPFSHSDQILFKLIRYLLNQLVFLLNRANEIVYHYQFPSELNRS